jgi:heme/copper-type cytochrome/quinol oxidase subunit 3
MSHEVHSHNAHHEHPDDVGSRNRLGVILILVADISFALSMMFVFFYLKSQNVHGMWLPKGDEEHPAIHPLSSNPAWLVTAIAALGMAIHYFGLRSARNGNQSALKAAGAFSLVAAIVASAMQWNTIATAPFTFHEGTYVSAFYLLTIMNQVHLFLTVFIAFGNWNRSRLNLYKSNYWHVDIVNVWWIWMAVSSGLGAFCLSMA